jgi:hypothetical protein
MRILRWITVCVCILALAFTIIGRFIILGIISFLSLFTRGIGLMLIVVLVCVAIGRRNKG